MSNARCKQEQNLSEKEEYGARIEEAENIVIEAIAKTMDLYGVTQSIGRLYGIMYFNDDPMTMDEMSQKLGMSKPSMSIGIHTLLDNEMVEKVWQRGVRKDLYVAEKDFFKTFVAFFSKKWEREADVNLQAIVQAEEILTELLNDPNLPHSVETRVKKDLQLMKESKRYYLWLKRLVQKMRNREFFFNEISDGEEEENI
jgi:DNA-binding transcriptional regulator GbsR (MarR family)